MKLSTEVVNDVVVVALRSKSLDTNNALSFKEAIASHVKQHSRMVLDLGEVEFVDSSGCGALLSVLRQLTEAGGDLKLVGVRKPVLALFKLIRLHRIVEIFDSRESATSAFRSEPKSS